MKRFLFLILLTLVPIITFAEAPKDTIIKCKAYTSYISWSMKNPKVVVYKLYKGGGDCDRSQFRFNNRTCANQTLKNRTATQRDYTHSGYEEGHLCNAEDMAGNCSLDSMTFKFWNCVPQTLQLNRGVWKSDETAIRELSQSDSLIVVCGSFFGTRTIGDGVFVPDTCWKVVYSLSKRKVIISYVYTNTATPVRTPMKINDLNNLIIKTYGMNITSLIFFR